VSAVVEQSVDGFLQHAFLVSNDDIRRLEHEQVLKPVVTVDHATIEIVKVGGSETSTFQRHQRT
jgi:hypothetical protein